MAVIVEGVDMFEQDEEPLDHQTRALVKQDRWPT